MIFLSSLFFWVSRGRRPLPGIELADGFDIVNEWTNRVCIRKRSTDLSIPDVTSEVEPRRVLRGGVLHAGEVARVRWPFVPSEVPDVLSYPEDRPMKKKLGYIMSRLAVDGHPELDYSSWYRVTLVTVRINNKPPAGRYRVPFNLLHDATDLGLPVATFSGTITSGRNLWEKERRRGARISAVSVVTDAEGRERIGYWLLIGCWFFYFELVTLIGNTLSEAGGGVIRLFILRRILKNARIVRWSLYFRRLLYRG